MVGPTTVVGSLDFVVVVVGRVVLVLVLVLVLVVVVVLDSLLFCLFAASRSSSEVANTDEPSADEAANKSSTTLWSDEPNCRLSPPTLGLSSAAAWWLLSPNWCR